MKPADTEYEYRDTEGSIMNPQRIKARLAAKGKKTSNRWKKNKKLLRGSNPR